MKTLTVGAELFYVDRRADMTIVMVAFSNFATAPKNEQARPQKQERLNYSFYVSSILSQKINI